MILIRSTMIGLLSLLLGGVSQEVMAVPYSLSEMNELPVTEILAEVQADLRCTGCRKRKYSQRFSHFELQIVDQLFFRLASFRSVFAKKKYFFSYHDQGHRLSNGMVAPMLL